MGFIWDLITLPFEIVSSSLECMFGCFFLVAVGGCCLFAVLVLNVL